MSKLSDAVINDGRLLEEKFKTSDGFISAGELDYNEFSSQLVRTVIYLQLKFSKDGVEDRYDKRKLDDFRMLARRFLTDLKDGTLTEASHRNASEQLKSIFPKQRILASSRKPISARTRLETTHAQF
jgi:hypothetical protein